MSDPLVPWEVYFGCVSAAAALLLGPLFERVLIAGDSDYEAMVNMGAHPLVDHLWSTETTEIAHDGGRYSRLERVRRIADHPVVRGSLRVCWENRDGEYNCGRRRKCLMTMTSLEALGARDRITTFPSQLDLDALAEVTVTHPVLLTLWQDVLDLVQERHRDDLEPAVARVVARAKEALGLPASYRLRGGTATAEASRAETERDELAARLDTVLSSRSWKLTRPLRSVARGVRGLR